MRERRSDIENDPPFGECVISDSDEENIIRIQLEDPFGNPKEIIIKYN